MAGIHPFETAGLGKAPFRCVGVSENVYSPAPGIVQAGGSCDYCGTGIRYEFAIRSHDGKEFKVGCDCVRKIGRDDNRLLSEVEAIERRRTADIRRAKREARDAPERARIADAFARLADPEIRQRLASQPHPSFPNASIEAGYNLLSHVEFLKANAGHSGKLRGARIIEDNS